MVNAGPVLHFGSFEAHLATGELRKNTRTIKLQPQPFKVLALLLERPGELVTREEIRQKVWGAGTFVDFEQGLNFAIKKIREALDDDAERPRYIETLPRRGYRFIAPVEPGAILPPLARQPAAIPPNRVVSIAEGVKAPYEPAGSQSTGSGALAVAAPPTVDRSPTGGTDLDRAEAPFPVTVSELSTSRKAEPTGQPVLIEEKVYGAPQLVLRPHWRLAAAGAALVVVGALTFLLRPTLPAPRVTGSSQVTHDGSDKERIVTDGSRIYFSSYRRETPSLYQVFAAGGETVPFDTPVPSPFVFGISPDRSELLVGSCYLGGQPSDCPLWILPVAGRSPRRLGSIVASDAAWSFDGKHVAYVRENSLYKASVDGTVSQKIASVAGATSLYWPRWSPDSKRLRFSVGTENSGTSLWEVSADGEKLHQLLSGWNVPPGECCGTWTPDGRYFLFQSDRGENKNIWVIREERSILRKDSHEPVQLTTGPTSATTAVPSRDGRKVFVETARLGELMRYDTASRQFEPYLSGISATGVNFSRDGRWVTYATYPERTLWRSKVDGSERLQLTFPPLYALQPRWSPDGTRIAFMGLKADKPWGIYVVSAQEGSVEQPLGGDQCGFDPTWSPDGNSLLFGCSPAIQPPGGRMLDLSIVNLRTHAVSKVPGSGGLWSPRWSPDGRQILALSHAPDRLMLFDVDSQRWRELVAGQVSYPEWSQDGNYVYLTDQGKGRPATGIFRVRISDRKLEQVAGLKDFRQPMIDWGSWAGLAPDDSPLLLREAGTQDIYALDVEWP